LLNCLYLK